MTHLASSTSTELLDHFVTLSGHALAPFDEAAVRGDDVLVVVDMQNDFMPGGPFGVAEGDAVILPIIEYMRLFQRKGCTVVATKDYHPIDHCSFTSHGGPFPPHCVQGSLGSRLVDDVAAAMKPLIQAGKGFVVFKGFSRDVDSYGAFEYGCDASLQPWAERLSHNPDAPDRTASWTGAFSLFSSLMQEDPNAPPDVMSVMSKVSLRDLLHYNGTERNVYVVGLALDYCVLDTALNAAALGRGVTILVDASRAAHIPDVGRFGTGFLNDPKRVVALCDRANVRLAHRGPAKAPAA